MPETMCSEVKPQPSARTPKSTNNRLVHVVKHLDFLKDLVHANHPERGSKLLTLSNSATALRVAISQSTDQKNEPIGMPTMGGANLPCIKCGCLTATS